jgi:hypothetical protein
VRGRKIFPDWEGGCGKKESNPFLPFKQKTSERKVGAALLKLTPISSNYHKYE